MLRLTRQLVPVFQKTVVITARLHSTSSSNGVKVIGTYNISSIKKGEPDHDAHEIVWRAGPLDADVLKKFPNATMFKCIKQGLTDIYAVRNLKYLRKLDCSNNELNNLNGIQDLEYLHELNCSRNAVTTMDHVSPLNRLDTLVCRDTKINNINFVVNLHQLKKFNMSYNQVVSLSPLLNSCHELTYLDCRNNILDSHGLYPIHDKQNLTYLDCTDTGINSLYPIRDLTNLVTLFCGGNKINNLQEIWNLKNLELLWITDNPINDSYRVIHVLKKLRTLCANQLTQEQKKQIADVAHRENRKIIF